MLRELLAVAARAALEWALATLLLANGAAFCLIAAAAARLRLGPPCILCARVHRLLCSSSTAAGDGRDALRLLLCDAHLAAAVAPAEPSAAHDHGGAAERKGALEAGEPDKASSGSGTHRVVSIGSEICEQDYDDEQRRGAAARSSTDEGNGPLVSLFELAPILSRPRDDDTSSLGRHAAPEDGDEPATDDRDDAVAERLASELRTLRRELEALRAELASERRARAEAEEYQRQLEEQGELDREAARLAMQLVHESETEKHGLQRQLDACRVSAQLYHSERAAAAAADDDGGGGCRREEANGGGGGDGNNYQSLVDFLPGSVYSSSPDLANLLKLYTDAGNGGGRRERGGYEASAVPAVAEEAEEEEEEEVAVAVTATAGTESGGSVDDATTTAIVAESSHERTHDCLVETVTEAA